MFSTFTTKSGKTLLIRAVDMRVLEDTSNGCVLIWESTPGQLMDRNIQGTAQENLDRLKAEEMAAIAAAQRQQAMAERVERGRDMQRMVRR